MASKFAAPHSAEAESSQPGADDNRYDLLVMNTEIGITGTVSIVALNEDEAVRHYERDNPTCAVISVLRTAN